MFDSIISILTYMLSSLIDAHTYIGVFLGVCFAPLWVKIWAFCSGYVTTKFPMTAVIFAKISSMASTVIAVLTPVAKEVEKKIDDQQK